MCVPGYCGEQYERHHHGDGIKDGGGKDRDSLCKLLRVNVAEACRNDVRYGC